MTSTNVLVTGATGYIGGSFLENILKDPAPELPLGNIHALVRSEAAASKLKNLGINAIVASFEETDKIKEAIQELEIDIVLHTADSFNPQHSITLLEGLEQRKAQTGRNVYFIHTSGSSSLSDKSGFRWPGVKDTDDVYALHKQTDRDYEIRTTEVTVVEVAEAKGITAYIVICPTIYGRNHNVFSNQYSIQLPAMIRSALSTGKVHDTASSDAIWPAVHIADLAVFYRLFLSFILSGKQLPSGKRDGFYFAVAHNFKWAEITAGLAKELYNRGLVTIPEPEPWSYEEAAKTLGFPPALTEIAFGSNDDIVPVKKELIGWVPKFDYEYMVTHLSDEVEDVLGQKK